MKKIRAIVLIQIILLISLIITQTFSFVTASELLPIKSKKIKWDISALKVTYDDQRNVYIAEDDVKIKGGDINLKADYLEFNNVTTDVYARGNVALSSGEDSITCDSLQLNLQSETGTIHYGILFMKQNNFYIKGNKIKKIGADTYRTDKGTITSCSGDTPDWKISANDIEVTIEGYGFAKHATFWAKKIPTLYTPYLIFPAKKERQTGLLAPRFSSSSRKGFEYEQPLFLAISQNQDATIYLDFMQKRGTKIAAEYRYIIDDESQGEFFFDYLYDQKIDDSTKKISDQRINANRYWIRSKIDQKLPLDYTLKLDIDVVSDADYLHEFKDGFTGFHGTSKYFEKTFGRSIDDYNDTTRESRLNLNKTWDNKALNIDFNWFDDVNNENTTLQTLPSIDYTSLKQKISSSPFYYNLNSSFDLFYRKDTDTTTSLLNGKRIDIHPTFSIPYKITHYLFIEPSIGLRETAWYAKNFQDSTKNNNKFTHRVIFDAHLNISTKISKIFNTNSDFAEKIKHEIIPEFKYTYIPDVYQDDLPYFNDIDRINKKNSITWFLTQKFTTRKTLKNNEKAYHEFAWIKLFQTYNIDEVKDNEHFSDLSFEGEFTLSKYLTLHSQLDWSPYDHHFTSNEISGTISNYRGDSLHAEYRYKREDSKSVIGILRININDGLSTYYSLEHDLFNEKRIESKIGLEFQGPCWSLITAYSDTPDDKSISIFIKLNGIGAFGTR